MTELPFGVIECAVCERCEARWSHSLQPERSQFRRYGKGHVWGSPVALCDACSALLLADDADGLLAASADPEPEAISALVAADLGAVDLDDLRPTGYRELVDAGFVPLENITGALYVQDGWPAEHRRSLAPRADDDVDNVPHGRYWFIRSPWPDVPLEDLFGLMLQEVDAVWQSSGPIPYSDEVAVLVMQDLFAAGEAEIRRRLQE